MNDFWPDSDYSCLVRTPEGRLRVTDAYLRRYFERPELLPVADSCPAERALHAALLAEPQRRVSPREVAALADADARANYAVMLRFRDRLLAHDTLEACYATLFRGDVSVPPDFVYHLAHAIVRGLLEAEENGLVARAAELFFRGQKVTVVEGQVMMADAETVERRAADGGLGAIGRLLREVQAPLRAAELNVLDAAHHTEYWPRADRYDTVLAVNPGQPGARALATMIERWIAHFHGVACTVEPIREIPDEDWRWHVGLDAEATLMLNTLYEGGTVEDEQMRRIVGLFRLEFANRAVMRPEVAGAPVFLGLAMREDGGLRLKPQNLLMNLPLARPA